MHVAGVLDADRRRRSFSTSADGAHRVVDDRALALGELEVETHAREADEDVREHDRRVDADEIDRLQRDLDGELGRAAHLEEAVLRADLAVLLHVAPAWRIIQTGVRSVGSRRAARKKRSL